MSFWTSICRTTIALAVCLLAIGSTAQTAHAAKPTQEELQTFKKLVKEGSGLRDSGEHWQALDKFQKARAILDHPKLTFNIGKLHQKTGACQKAKDLYTNVLERPKLPDGVRVEVVQQLKTTDQCRPFATLDLTCAPASARARLAGKTVSCPFRNKVSPGELQVMVSAPGHKQRAFSVSLEPGQLVEKSVQLRESEDTIEAPVAGKGGGDGADGSEAGATPWMTYAAYGSMGVGAALLVGGIFSDYGAQSRAEEFVAANNDGDRDRAQQLKGEADSAQVRTVVLYSAGAVLVGGGVALWAIDTGQEGDAGARVSAEVGWAGQGPAVRGVLTW